MSDRIYIAIDLKSFYASVECVDRHLDPMTSCLVVADESRTEKTICLAVSPALKSFGIPGRPRLFEVIRQVARLNAGRRRLAPGRRLTGSSSDTKKLAADPSLALDYIVAPPQMARYMQISAQIYQIYLNYIAPEDMHVYSIDEVFIDATSYLKTYGKTPEELARTIILDVLASTGITAAAGIGSNLYLCKIAMDIEAKHSPADEHGVRIARLDELSYRRRLWNHRPLTDFWRVGKGYASRLERIGLFTMGDIARCSLGRPEDYYNEDLLYSLFGVNAELLIDHAWGWEPCTISDIRSYRPENRSIGSGQVLPCPYPYEKTRLAVREMADSLALQLVEQELLTSQLVLTIDYDRENLQNPALRKQYQDSLQTDRYGRAVPRHAHGTENLECPTSSARLIMQAATSLFERIADEKLLARRITLTAIRVIAESEAPGEPDFQQLTLFTDYDAQQKQKETEKNEREREKKMQQAVLEIKKKFGKNAVLRGMNLQEGATAADRNNQIGGHRA